MNKNLEKTKQNLVVRSSTYLVKPKLLDNFDPKILDFVVVLTHLGFNTFSSCQGHYDNPNFVDFYPYVMFCSENAEGFPFKSLVFEGRQNLVKEYKSLLKEQAKLIEYLNEFYEDRGTPMKYRLIVKTRAYCRTSIQPYFSSCRAVLESVKGNQKEQKRLNKIFLKEIDDFTEFLKAKI